MSQQVTEVSETDKDYKLNQISQELKDKMIDDIRKGVEYKYFTIKEFKNGKAQIIRKKTNVQTKDVKESKKNTKQDDDNDDPILDHLAKIHETIGSLKTKNKKRKKQIEEIYSLFNGNDSEIEEEPATKPAKKEQIVIEEESKPVKEPVKKDLKTNLRSRLKYLS